MTEIRKNLEPELGPESRWKSELGRELGRELKRKKRQKSERKELKSEPGWKREREEKWKQRKRPKTSPKLGFKLRDDIKLEKQLEEFSEKQKEKQEEKEEEEIIYGEWVFPVGTGELGYPDKKGRPVVKFSSENIKGEIPEEYKKPKPIYVLFPLYSEKAVEKLIKKQEIPICFLRKTLDKKGNKICITQVDNLRTERKKGDINKEIIDGKIKRYSEFIEEGIEKGEISEEEGKKFISTSKAKREILLFMFPGGILSLKKIEETLRTKFGIKNAILKNESIISLIAEKKKPEDLTKEDLVFFETRKEKYKSGKEKYEAIQRYYVGKMKEIVSVLSKKSVEEINKLPLQKVRKLARNVFNKFAVHGKLYVGKKTVGKKTREVILSGRRSDLDGRACLALFKKARFKIEEIKYVSPGEIAEGYINLDTGGVRGIKVINRENKTICIDQHDPKFSHKTSVCSAELTYLLLFFNGFFKEKKEDPILRAALRFVSWADRKKFPIFDPNKEVPKDVEDKKKYQKEIHEDRFNKSYRTILGLERFVDFEELYNFLKKKVENEIQNEIQKRSKGEKDIKEISKEILKLVLKIITSPLTDEELKELDLTEKSKKQKEIIEQSKRRLENLEKKGWIIDIEQHGKIAIDICGSVRGGYDAALGYGLNGIIIYCPKQPRQSFFISIDGADLRDISKEIKKTFNQKEVICLQENMVIKPMVLNPKFRTPLKVPLEDIIKALGGKVPDEGELKNYLDEERQRRTGANYKKLD